jgi:hypothetical protein
LTPVTKDIQAKKTCKVVDPKNEESHGLLYEMVLGKQSGGKLIRDLKKLRNERT